MCAERKNLLDSMTFDEDGSGERIIDSFECINVTYIGDQDALDNALISLHNSGLTSPS